MSFSFRDKPRLSDRLRGKSGDELINELKSQLDQERKMFFDTAPNWGSVHPSAPFSSRTGFPFDDDMMSRTGRQDIRSHLDDLAQRHPEFAEQLRCPPWGGEMGGSPSHASSWGRNRRGSNECDGHSQASSSSSSVGNNETGGTSPKPEEARGRNPIPQHGLRNTVDLGQKQGESGRDDGGSRGQRSMSAPPDGRNQQPSEPQKQPQQAQQPQRFVSRVNITPGKPPVAPQKQQSPQQPTSNVRHIPIFVEGRDEPILPKNVTEEPVPEQVFSQRIPPQSQQPSFSKPQTFTSHHQFQPQQRFYSPSQQTRTEYTRQQQNVPQPKPETIFPQQTSASSTHQTATQQPKEAPNLPQQPKPPQSNDPIYRVQAVQKDVENLQRMVENFGGTSRKDKQYIYLDEMLTRNLLKLDDIDTEGKENVRQARKDAIRSIQRCISILESKVPAAEDQNEAAMPEGAREAHPDTMEAAVLEKMEAETVEPEPAAEENLDSLVKETVEHVEKMDVEPAGLVQSLEQDSCKSEIKEESLSLAPSDDSAATQKADDRHKKDATDTQLCMDVALDSEVADKEEKKDADDTQMTVDVAANTDVSHKEDKKNAGDKQCTMAVPVDTEVAKVSDMPSEQVASEKSAEKCETCEMEVEPVVPVASVQKEESGALLPKETTVKPHVEAQNGDVIVSQLPLQDAAVEQETKDEVAKSGCMAGSETSEVTVPNVVETTAVQVQPSASDLKDAPKAEVASPVAEETAKDISSEQNLEKDIKQETDKKKKKTGKKLKSPAKKPPKQASENKPDEIASSDEAQKS